jgi:DNA-binding transcriptional LysR family regulator
MELRQIRAFLEVANERHFGRAALRLNLTQPALTQRIQALERELGVQLLQRNAREVRLTDAGELLLPYARRLTQIEDTALRNLKDHASGSAGRLRIAYLNSGDVAIPGQILAEFRRRYTDVDVQTSSAASFINLDRMIRGELDTAFIAITGAAPPGVEVLWVSRLPLVLALPSGHRLAKLDPVPVSALAGEPFVLYPPATSPTLVPALERWLTRYAGGNLSIVAYEPPDEALQAVAKSDAMMTIVNGGRAQSVPVPGIAYRQLSPSPLVDYGLAHMKDEPSAIVANLLEIAVEVARRKPLDATRNGELLFVGPY